MVATLDNVRINQLSDEGTAWLQSILTTLDAKDVDAYTGFMADDVEVTFNNGDMTMRGRDAVSDGLAEFWQSFGTLRHDELNIYGTDRNLVHEARNYYTTLDGRDVTIRAVAWIDRNDDGEVMSLRIYNDQSPLFEPHDQG
ncbi:MAG: nuclear transport factor 2 family protein [Ilumatobacteraceae bacterium]